MAAAQEPPARSADASSVTETSDDNPIVLLDRVVGLKPLDTGLKGER